MFFLKKKIGRKVFVSCSYLLSRVWQENKNKFFLHKKVIYFFRNIFLDLIKRFIFLHLWKMLTFFFYHS